MPPAVLAYFHLLPNAEFLQGLNEMEDASSNKIVFFSSSWPSGFQMKPQFTTLDINIHRCRNINGNVAMWCSLYSCQNLLSINAHLL